MVASRESTQSSTSQPASPGTTYKEEGNEEAVRRHDKNISPSLAAAAAVAAGQPRACLCASYITQTFLMFTINIASLLV